MLRLSVDQAKIADFCCKHHIRRLALFGSVLRDDFGPDSDVDVLVEFEAGHVPGLAFFAIEEELFELLGRKVDLNTPKFLSPAFRSQVEKCQRGTLGSWKSFLAPILRAPRLRKHGRTLRKLL